MMRAPNFLKQNEVLDARKHRYKAINCSRRSGKSQGEVIDHLEIGLEFPGSKQVYGGLTLDSVSEICWDIFKEYDEEYKLGCHFNNVKKICTLPNDSRIRLFGVDASEKQIKKILGQKLRKVSLDEAGSMTNDMVKIVYQMIDPALIDLSPNSWLTLLGTCENIPNTFFEKVTEGKEISVPWKVFKWSGHDNPFMAEQWAREISLKIKQNPLVVETSWFKTHYLNQWCADDELLIIPTTKLQQVEKLPDGEFYYYLSLDLGYNDASAFVVMAWSSHDPRCFVVEAYKKSGMDFTDVANQVKKIQRQYPITKIKVDGANKQGVEEMKKRHGLPLTPSDKTGKTDFLHLMRDDVIQGNLVLVKGKTGELFTEWSALQWKDDNKQDEDPRCQNHLSDATLYDWRECRNYTWKPKDPEKSLDEQAAEWEREEAAEMANMDEIDAFAGFNE